MAMTPPTEIAPRLNYDGWRPWPVSVVAGMSAVLTHAEIRPQRPHCVAGHEDSNLQMFILKCPFKCRAVFARFPRQLHPVDECTKRLFLAWRDDGLRLRQACKNRPVEQIRLQPQTH